MPAIIELPEVFEGSTPSVSMEFRDDTGSPVTPTSAWYKIVNQDGTVIKAKTVIEGELSPEITVTLEPEDTRIISDANKRERRVVVVQAIYSAERRINQEFSFSVVNLRYGVAADGI
jgi:hypothetical protein